MNAGQTLQAVIGGLASALCVLAMAAGGSLGLPLSWVAAVPLFLVGLSSGPAFALRGALVGAVVVALFSAPALVIYLLGIGIPVVVLSWAAVTPLDLDDSGVARPPDAGNLLLIMVGYAILVITVAGFAFAGYEGGLTGLLLSTVREPLQAVLTAMELELSDQEVEDMARTLAVSVPAALGQYWVIWAIVNMAIAQVILRRSGKALRQNFGILSVSLPARASIAFLIVIAASYAASSIMPGSVTAVVASNAAVLMVLIFFLVGLAVIHTVTLGRPVRVLILTLFYLLILASGWLAIVVAGLGIIEQWARLRERYAQNRPNEEE